MELLYFLVSSARERSSLAGDCKLSKVSIRPRLKETEPLSRIYFDNAACDAVYGAPIFDLKFICSNCTSSAEARQADEQN